MSKVIKAPLTREQLKSMATIKQDAKFARQAAKCRRKQRKQAKEVKKMIRFCYECMESAAKEGDLFCEVTVNDPEVRKAVLTALTEFTPTLNGEVGKDTEVVLHWD